MDTKKVPSKSAPRSGCPRSQTERWQATVAARPAVLPSQPKRFFSSL